MTEAERWGVAMLGIERGELDEAGGEFYPRAGSMSAAAAAHGRFDDPAWRPTALGCVGPPGLLGRFMRGDQATLYLALSPQHLRPPAIDAPIEPHLRIVTGRASLALCDATVAPAPRPRCLTSVPDANWVGAVLFTSDGEGVRAFSFGYIAPSSPYVGHVHLVWTGYPGTTDYERYAMGELFIHALASRGVVAMIAEAATLELRDYMVAQYPGLVPLRTAIADRGLLDEDGRLVV